MFAVRYAHFHELLEKQELDEAALDLIAIFHEDLAPKSWWAILLCDSVQLLQHGKRGNSSEQMIFSPQTLCRSITSILIFRYI
jgi:hypothetical protein